MLQVIDQQLIFLIDDQSPNLSGVVSGRRNYQIGLDLVDSDLIMGFVSFTPRIAIMDQFNMR